jgi:hypothetical protein
MRKKKAPPKKAPPNRRASPKGGRQPKGVKLGDGVVGVAKHPRGYQIRYVKNGKKITAYRKHEDSANEFAARMHAQLIRAAEERESGAEAPKVEAARGRARYGDAPSLDGMQLILWDLMLLVTEHPRDEDYQRALKSAASGVTAMSKVRDRAQEERTLARVEQKIDLARKRRAARQVESAEHNQPSGADRSAPSVH